jgi:2,3-dihydroxy-p-cumate/2,3-dihydroxybenzoate 3,4-dioxygenase
MSLAFRELRYVRCQVADLDTAGMFAEQIFGLMCEERTETEAMFRSDHRFYSLCLSTELPPAIGLRVDHVAQLQEYAESFAAAGYSVTPIDGAEATRRIIKRGIAIVAPNGVHLEIVWRHMESGQPFHGSRHTGLNGFAAVQLASKDVEADAKFWNAVPGLDVSDYVGNATFYSLGSTHHQVALYPSSRDGLLGAIWQVETFDNVMRHWHFMRDRQVPIAHGPGRQPTSQAAFVSARTPEGFLMSYATQMSAPAELGPRQFSDEPQSHCEWGSPTDMTEFGGEAA